MMKCDICGSTEFNAETVSEVFIIDKIPYLVENIPASVCSRCGDITFDRETAEKIRKMLHGDAKPDRTLNIAVYSFAV